MKETPIFCSKTNLLVLATADFVAEVAALPSEQLQCELGEVAEVTSAAAAVADRRDSELRQVTRQQCSMLRFLVGDLLRSPDSSSRNASC